MVTSERKRAPFGSWQSPISAELVASSSNAYFEPKISERGTVFFLELRPLEKGRYAIVSVSPDGEIRDVIPKEFNARNRVHEYGGGSYEITNDGSAIFFSNFADQRVYSVLNGEKAPTAITTNSNCFYADYDYDQKRGRLVCVQEDHGNPGEAVNTIVSLPTNENNQPEVLISGSDFYSTPRISPNGDKIAWLSWNHPLLPFLGSEVWLGDVSGEGAISNHRLIAGGAEESIAEPRWSPEGILYFVSDRSNWWNIYRLANDGVERVAAMDAEFAGPHWIFGLSSYGFVSEKEIVCTYSRDGFSRIALINAESKKIQDVDGPFTDVRYVTASDRFSVVIGGSPSSPSEVSLFYPGPNEFRRMYPVVKPDRIEHSDLSLPRAIEYPTEGSRKAFALYYAPKNRHFEGIDGTLPPLIVISHGGPTSRCRSDLNLGIQYWTSRGFGVVDVNYGGSTGYGREYRMRLKGNWGIVDMDDCVNAAKYLVADKKADSEKLIIRGGSAGGYTTLSTLAFRTAFKAGASYFGISDLEVFTKDTHKFESRYMDFLESP